MSFSSIAGLLGEDNPTAIGTNVGLIFPATCPVAEEEPCTNCPTHTRGETGLQVVFDALAICANLDQIPNLLTVAAVGDEPGGADWKTHTKPVADHLEKRGVPFGFITTGNTLGTLTPEIERTPGIKRIGVSLDVPEEHQDGFRTSPVFKAVVDSLKVALTSAHMQETIEVVQVVRKMEWLFEVLKVIKELKHIKRISVSPHIDFKGSGSKMPSARILDLNRVIGELSLYVSEANALGIEVVIDDLLDVLPARCGLPVRRQGKMLDVVRMGYHQYVEANNTTFGRLDRTVTIAGPSDVPAAIDRAIKRSRLYQDNRPL